MPAMSSFSTMGVEPANFYVWWHRAVSGVVLDSLDGLAPQTPIHSGRLSDYAVVPIRPMWLGFTMNTLLYAVLLWSLFSGLTGLRRSIRKRRGLCPACAYPAGEPGVCSECGTMLGTVRLRLAH